MDSDGPFLPRNAYIWSSGGFWALLLLDTFYMFFAAKFPII